MSRNTILIIDDDPDFRRLIRMYLKTIGIQSLDAPDCAAGLEVLQAAQGDISLVLLDYFMPGMAPRACVTRLREFAGDEVQVVLCTAAVDAAARASELGFTRWLAKPFDLVQLRELIDSVSIETRPAPESSRRWP
jgi:CheY-like chemotaxis protein